MMQKNDKTKGVGRWKKLMLAAWFFLTLMPMSGVLADAKMVAEGRAIVAEHCTRCHVVPDINPKGGIESTPSFRGMKHLADWRDRFEVFFTLPPHPALVKIDGLTEERDKSRPAFVKEIKLSVDDIDRILAYVDTIEK